MKCQILFSGENKKTITSLSSVQILSDNPILFVLFSVEVVKSSEETKKLIISAAESRRYLIIS